jgi:hypothetical protein
MYKLNGKGTSETLTPENAQAKTLKIINIQDVPRDWQSRLVSLK